MSPRTAGDTQRDSVQKKEKESVWLEKMWHIFVVLLVFERGSQQKVVAHAFNSSIQEAELEDFLEFEPACSTQFSGATW